MVTAQQTRVAIGPTPYPPQVRPAQLYPAPAAVTPAFDISTLLTSIMPLIMLVMVMQMMKPLMGGMGG